MLVALEISQPVSEYLYIVQTDGQSASQHQSASYISVGGRTVLVAENSVMLHEQSKYKHLSEQGCSRRETVVGESSKWKHDVGVTCSETSVSTPSCVNTSYLALI